MTEEDSDDTSSDGGGGGGGGGSSSGLCTKRNGVINSVQTIWERIIHAPVRLVLSFAAPKVLQLRIDSPSDKIAQECVHCPSVAALDGADASSLPSPSVRL